MQPESVAQLAFDDYRPALDHAHRNTAANFSFGGVDLHDVENEGLTGAHRQPADPGPLAVAASFHYNIRENPERADRWFGQGESLVASSIGHGSIGEQRTCRDTRDAFRARRTFLLPPPVYSSGPAQNFSERGELLRSTKKRTQNGCRGGPPSPEITLQTRP